jgi:hypothetical protein
LTAANLLGIALPYSRCGHAAQSLSWRAVLYLMWDTLQVAFVHYWKWSFPVPAWYIVAPPNKLCNRFEFHPVKCESADFLFLIRIAPHSKSFVWHFQNGVELPNLLEKLEEYSDDQINDFFGLVEDLLELGRNDPPGEEDIDPEFWKKDQVQSKLKICFP